MGMHASTLVTIVVVLAFALSAAGTELVRRYALARAILDMPNARSSHTIPTPRGGGLSIAIVWLLSLVVFFWLGVINVRVLAAFAGGSALVALVGWLDDRRDLRARTRLACQLAAAIWLVVWVGAPTELHLGAMEIPLGPAGFMVTVLGVIWFINLFNFMDGIDGIAGVESLIGGVACGVMLLLGSAGDLAALAFALAFAAGGFLVWNWPPAKIFMGDVSSGMLGYVFAGLIVAGDTLAHIPAPLLVVLFGVFVCDATYTLVRRLLRGERVYEAHRSHMYQRLVQAGWSHRAVTTLTLVINVALGAVATFAMLQPDYVFPAIAAALGGLFGLGAILHYRLLRGLEYS